VNETGGGIGGLVKLATTPHVGEGFNVQYVQGVGSFKTFDEFLRLTYGGDHGTSPPVRSTPRRPTTYKYTNHDKKINIYDDDKNIVGQYHPVERNRSGAFKDLHLLQEVYYDTRKGDKRGVERLVHPFQSGAADAHDRLRRRDRFREPPAGTDVPPASCHGTTLKRNWKVGVKGG